MTACTGWRQTPGISGLPAFFAGHVEPDFFQAFGQLETKIFLSPEQDIPVFDDAVAFGTGDS